MTVPVAASLAIPTRETAKPEDWTASVASATVFPFTSGTVERNSPVETTRDTVVFCGTLESARGDWEMTMPGLSELGSRWIDTENPASGDGVHRPVDRLADHPRDRDACALVRAAPAAAACGGQCDEHEEDDRAAGTRACGPIVLRWIGRSAARIRSSRSGSGRCRSRSSKPVRSGNPRLGRFDSCAAPLAVDPASRRCLLPAPVPAALWGRSERPGACHVARPDCKLRHRRMSACGFVGHVLGVQAGEWTSSTYAMPRGEICAVRAPPSYSTSRSLCAVRRISRR